MKVIDVNGRLTSISKTIPKGEALGNSIDVYKYSTEAGARFFGKCQEYVRQCRHEIDIVIKK